MYKCILIFKAEEPCLKEHKTVLSSAQYDLKLSYIWKNECFKILFLKNAVLCFFCKMHLYDAK